jgi:hypothetical protein
MTTALLCLASPLIAQRTQENIAINPAEQYLQAAADHERAGLNLPPLRRDPALVRAARMHALQMVEHNGISHQFAGEPDLAARGSAAGARFSLISENVAESPNAIRIHDAWMKSEGHRHNLLDPRVDSVGIVVIEQGHQLFAVEDFEKSVPSLTINQQEDAVAQVVSGTGIAVRTAEPSARRTCAGPTDRSAGHGPSFVMRYTTASLDQIPDELKTKIASGKYDTAVVAACSTETGDFTMYSLAVLLYSRQGYAPNRQSRLEPPS